MEQQLSALLSSASSQAAFPPFFLFVDATSARGRRLLRWTRNAVLTSSPSSASPFQAVLGSTSASSVQLAFTSILSLYRRLHPPSSSSSPPAPLRIALASSNDCLLSYLLPSYISALASTPSLPLRIFPVPLSPSSSHCRVALHLARADNLYLSLFFSSAYRHALEGEESVEAEGGVVLDAVLRYVMDAQGAVRLHIGEVMIEGVGAAGKERAERQADVVLPLPSAAGPGNAAALPLPHPPPLAVAPGAAEVFSAAPPLLTPSTALHAVSAPVPAAGRREQLDDDEEEEAAMGGDAAAEAERLSDTQLLHQQLEQERERDRERERAAEMETISTGRLTLPFVSDVAFISCGRHRASSDSDLQRRGPPGALPATSPAAGHAASPSVVHGDDGTEERKATGEAKRSTLSSFTRFLTSGRGSSAHNKSLSTVQLPPAKSLLVAQSEQAAVRMGRRRNSDSQTHYGRDGRQEGEAAGRDSARAVSAHATPAASAALPADLQHAPVLGRSVQLHYWSLVSSKGRHARRSSLGDGGGAPAVAGGARQRLKKHSIKATFDRILVQRLTSDTALPAAAEPKGRDGRAEPREHRRSIMAVLTDRPSPHPASAEHPASFAASALQASATFSPATSAPAASTAASATAASPSTPALSLLPSQLLLLARRRPAKEPSLLTRLRDESQLIVRPVSKLILSSPVAALSLPWEREQEAGRAEAGRGGRGGGSWGVVVDGVEVDGAGLVSVSAQVSGRIKTLQIAAFGGGAGKDD